MLIDSRNAAPGEDAQRLAARAREFAREGSVCEAVVSLDMALGLLQGAPVGPLHAELLREKGVLLRDIGETSIAAALLKRSMDIAQYVRSERGVTLAQCEMAVVLARRGDIAGARRLLDDAAGSAVAAADPALHAAIAASLGELAAIRGDTTDAQARYQGSLSACRAAGDAAGMGVALTGLGRLYIEMHQLADAEQSLEQSQVLARDRGDLYMEALIHVANAELMIASGRLPEAERECEQLLAIARRRGDRLRRAQALRLYGMIAEQRAELSDAADKLEEARQLAAQGEDARLAAQVLCELGEVSRRRGEIERARTAWQQALAAFQKFRGDEGNVLEQDVKMRIGSILKNLQLVEIEEPKRIPVIRERLTQFLNEAVGRENVDQNRFEQELIYYIDKLDITEEKIRLKSHCDYFIETLKSADANGKKLGFISQEIGREINTLGSKANDANIQKLVVGMKEELEKIKEQLLNVL